jgi:hypothetical protein
MEAYMWNALWLFIGFYAGLFVALAVTGYARAVEVAERPLRMEKVGAVVERLDFGRPSVDREWSLKVLN